MSPEHIDKLKREYTDKYVAVDGKRPELARFKDIVGQVRTVNMSGRALVEFADYHLNIGWYDIDIDFLKVVDKPEPKAKETAKKPAAKAKPKAAPAATEKKLSPLEMARQMDSKKAGGDAKKMSTSDVLAAARGGAGGTTKEKPADKGTSKMSTADILAAARGQKGGSAEAAAPKSSSSEKESSPAAKAKADPGKMSTADILAAARAEKNAASTADEPVAAEPAAAEAETSEAPAAETAAPSAGGSGETVDRSKMTVDEMIAWCREHDSK